jgi:REP element-mobilizing transposase RayT
MPSRKLHFEDNKFYHIDNRGFLKMSIFKSENDYKMFISLISKYSEGKIEIFAYGLVPNHYHFLVKQLSKNGVCYFFTNIQRVYSEYFNDKYNRKGALYEGRFFAEEVRDNQHFQNLVKYILNNPLKHKLVKLGADGISGLRFI